MQESFKEFFIKELAQKRQKATFWLNHGFFFVAILFVTASGLVSASGEISWITLLVIAILYPFGALAFEAYLAKQKYKENS